MSSRPRLGVFYRCVSLLLIVILSGCAHSVWIATTPPGAQVRVDGQNLGQTPTFFVDNGGLGHTYRLELEKPGYAPRELPLPQEWNDGCVAASIVGGVFFFLPFIGLFWCHLLPFSGYQFNLHSEGNAPSAAPPSNPNPPTPEYPPAPSYSPPASEEAPPEPAPVVPPKSYGPPEETAPESAPSPSPVPQQQKGPKAPPAPNRISI